MYSQYKYHVMRAGSKSAKSSGKESGGIIRRIEKSDTMIMRREMKKEWEENGNLHLVEIDEMPNLKL